MTTLLAIRALLGRIPWQVYAALAVVALLAFTYRAGWNARDEKADAEMAAYVASVADAQEAARAAQQAAMEAAARRYAQLAERMDDEAKQARVAAMGAADRYIAANRVRCPSNGSIASGPGGSAENHDPAVPATVPGDGFVAVRDSDVRACTAAVIYAHQAYEWAKGLEAGE